MNEIAIKENDIKKDVASKLAIMVNLAIAPSNAKQYDTLRKENNDYIKKVKDSIEEARKRYLAPFDEEAKKYLEAISPLEIANKDMSAKILEAKKIAFKEDMRHEFDLIAMPDADGEFPDFDEIYDPSWYAKTKATAKELMSYKVKAYCTRKDQTEACIMFKGTKEELRKLKAFARDEHIDIEVNELEGK